MYPSYDYFGEYNSELRNELLNRELCLHIDELRYIVDRRLMDYNHCGRTAAWIMQPWELSRQCNIT